MARNGTKRLIVMNNFQVAIDGPASAGKSTVAKILATNFGFIYVDTGAMYRAITLATKNAGLSYDDEIGIAEIINQQKIEFIPGDPVQRVILNDQDVTEEIRSPEITNNVSVNSALAIVRENLMIRQRQIADNHSVVMDGRDIGTTVLPNAQVKIFLIADVEERAQRRYKENQSKGIETDLQTLIKEIRERDHKDSTREISPLTKAFDAIEIDTSGKSVIEIVSMISEIIDEKIK